MFQVLRETVVALGRLVHCFLGVKETAAHMVTSPAQVSSGRPPRGSGVRLRGPCSIRGILLQRLCRGGSEGRRGLSSRVWVLPGSAQKQQPRWLGAMPGARQRSCPKHLHYHPHGPGSVTSPLSAMDFSTVMWGRWSCCLL